MIRKRHQMMIFRWGYKPTYITGRPHPASNCWFTGGFLGGPHKSRNRDLLVSNSVGDMGDNLSRLVMAGWSASVQDSALVD